MSTATASEIDLAPERVQRWLEEDPSLQLIDVREPYEREAGHIAGSRHIELAQLPSEAATLGRERPGGFSPPASARSSSTAASARARRWPRRRCARPGSTPTRWTAGSCAGPPSSVRSS